MSSQIKNQSVSLTSVLTIFVGQWIADGKSTEDVEWFSAPLEGQRQYLGIEQGVGKYLEKLVPI